MFAYGAAGLKPARRNHYDSRRLTQVYGPYIALQTLSPPRWALTMALRQRRPAPGLVHHSDRGVQYPSHDYTALLKQNGAQISMSLKGNPYDNAACEVVHDLWISIKSTPLPASRNGPQSPSK